MTITPETHNTPQAMDAFYTTVDEGYFEDRAWMYAYVVDYLKQLLPASADVNMADFGCGCGQLMFLLMDAFKYAFVFGFEYSKVAIQRSGLEHYIFQRDLTDLSDFPNSSFVHGFCIQTLEHIKEYPKALVQMMRTLKHGGSLILTVPNNDGWGGHFHHWTVDGFREMLETYGEVVECFAFGREKGGTTNILARVVKV